MKLENVAGAAARPRGRRERTAHNLNSQVNSDLRSCLSLIYISIPFGIVVTLLGAGRSINHQPAIQEDHILFRPHHFDKTYFSKQTGSQYNTSTERLLFSPLALLTWVFSKTITALAQGLSWDQSLFKSPIFHRPGPFCAEDRASRYRRVSTKTVISCLSYLALGLLAIFLLRSRIHQAASDFCLGGTQHIQQLHQAAKNSKLRILTALFIAPSSSDQIAFLNKIVNYSVHKLKIEELFKMDEPKNPYPGIYQPVKDRLQDEEAMTLRDTIARERAAKEKAAKEKAELLKRGRQNVPTNNATSLAKEGAKSLMTDGKEGPSNRAANLARPSVTFAPEPNFVRPRRFNEYWLDKRNWEADGRDALRINLDDVSSSTDSSSTGPIMSVIRKTKSTIFGVRSMQEGDDVPTMQRQSFVSKAASSLFSSSMDRRERPSVVGGHSFGLPLTQGPTGPIRIRDLAMEAAAREMGFVLDTDRFGFQEVFVGDSAPPTQIQEEALSTAGTVADSSMSDDEDDYTDDEGTVYGEGDTEAISKNKESLCDMEDSQSDSMAWLANAFSPSTLDLLKDFGTPPRAETSSPQSSSTYSMGSEVRMGANNFDAPTEMGELDTYRAEQLNINEITKHRAETEALVEKTVGKVNAKTRGAQQTPTKTGSSNPKGSSRGESSGKRPSHKKSKSQEGGFFKSLIGTTEPSLVAWEQLQERSLMEAKADRKDPDLAAKLKVSSRQLPPEAPKPASKEPVPKDKSGASNILRRFSSMDNLKRKDTKSSGSPESKNYSARNVSQHTHSSQSKDTSLTSITEESAGGFKSPEGASARSISSSSGALVPEDQANINEDNNDKVLRSNPPSRSPPPLPVDSTYKFFVKEEIREEQRTGAEETKTPQRLNVNKPLPEISPHDVAQDKRDARESGSKGKEWAYKHIFRK